MDNMLMTGMRSPGGAMDAPQSAAPEPMSPEALAGAHGNLGTVIEGLLGLAGKPRGSLSKRDLFDAAGEMIARGAFSAPQAKQRLVAQLSQIPDDEPSVRAAVGEQLLKLVAMRQALHHHYGAA